MPGIYTIVSNWKYRSKQGRKGPCSLQVSIFRLSLNRNFAYILCQLFDIEVPPDKHMIHKLQSSQANWKSLRDTVETNSYFRYSGR